MGAVSDFTAETTTVKPLTELMIVSEKVDSNNKKLCNLILCACLLLHTEGAVSGKSKGEREDIIKDVRKLVEKTGFHLHVVPLESVS